MNADSGLVSEVREAAGEPQGALILLHGRATDERDLFPLLDIFDPEKRLFGITPGGPFTDQPPGGRHWYAIKEIGYPEPRTFAEGYERLAGFLDGVLAERGIGWEQTIIGGFSQGGVMSHSLGLGKGRPVPAGILAMSGFVPKFDETGSEAPWEPDFETRQKLPVMITHGELDPIIGIEFGREARDLLSSNGLDVTYHESPMPHTIDPRLVPEIAAWVGDRVGGAG